MNSEATSFLAHFGGMCLWTIGGAIITMFITPPALRWSRVYNDQTRKGAGEGPTDVTAVIVCGLFWPIVVVAVAFCAVRLLWKFGRKEGA